MTQSFHNLEVFDLARRRNQEGYPHRPLNAGVAGVGGKFQVAGQKPVQSFDTARKRRHFFDGDVLACRKGRTVAGGRGRMGRLALGKEVAAKAQEA